MMYLMRGSLLARSFSANPPASQPRAGSWVMSSAVTMPTPPSRTQGL
jgi:hypothetical protein